VKGLGEEDGWGEGIGVKAEFRSGVSEGTGLGGIVAIPAACCEAVGRLTLETRRFPRVDLGANRVGKVGAYIDYPGNRFGKRFCREDAGA